ncbi:hypothetical protein LRD69_15825 [Streptomyces sp. JH14]|nr:hypothetical protein [Streptomyces sp. JH14]MDF6043571.1 hypothetical protein [Streptomyces sp. JH14]
MSQPLSPPATAQHDDMECGILHPGGLVANMPSPAMRWRIDERRTP